MKFHCNACGRDFTTLSERDDSKKFAMHHLVLDKMKCPHCGASNWGYKSGGGWNPFSREIGEIREPNIIVHPQCRPHIGGNFNSPEGMVCYCDKTCKSFFNCLTGNVDDGDYVAPLEKSREERIAEAKAYVEKKKQDDAVKAFKSLRDRLGKENFGYQFRKEMWYARYGGTIWKLSPQDVEAIIKETWQTPQTQIIHKSITKRGVSPVLAKTLLNAEIYYQRVGLT